MRRCWRLRKHRRPRTRGTRSIAIATAARATFTVRVRGDPGHYRLMLCQASGLTSSTVGCAFLAACASPMCAELGVCGCTLEDSDIQAAGDAEEEAR